MFYLCTCVVLLACVDCLFPLHKYSALLASSGLGQPTDASVESWKAFPFLESDAIINGLKAELPVYLAAAEHVNVLNEEQKVEWWHRQEELRPWLGYGGKASPTHTAFFCSRRKGVFNPESLIQRAARLCCRRLHGSQRDGTIQQAISARRCLQYAET